MIEWFVYRDLDLYGPFIGYTYNEVYSWAMYKFDGKSFAIFNSNDFKDIKL